MAVAVRRPKTEVKGLNDLTQEPAKPNEPTGFDTLPTTVSTAIKPDLFENLPGGNETGPGHGATPGVNTPGAMAAAHGIMSNPNITTPVNMLTSPFFGLIPSMMTTIGKHAIESELSNQAFGHPNAGKVAVANQQMLNNLPTNLSSLGKIGTAEDPENEIDDSANPNAIAPDPEGTGGVSAPTAPDAPATGPDASGTAGPNGEVGALHSGGMVPDTQPGMEELMRLLPGEMVMNRDAVAQHGDELDEMNRGGFGALKQESAPMQGMGRIRKLVIEFAH